MNDILALIPPRSNFKFLSENSIPKTWAVWHSPGSQAPTTLCCTDWYFVGLATLHRSLYRGRRFIDLLLSPDYHNHKNLWNCHKIKHTIYQITTQRIVHNDIGNHLAKTSQKGCQKFLVICQEFKSCLYTLGIWRERKLMPMPLAHYKLLNFNYQGIFLSVWDV